MIHPMIGQFLGACNIPCYACSQLHQSTPAKERSKWISFDIMVSGRVRGASCEGVDVDSKDPNAMLSADTESLDLLAAVARLLALITSLHLRAAAGADLTLRRFYELLKGKLELLAAHLDRLDSDSVQEKLLESAKKVVGRLNRLISHKNFLSLIAGTRFVGRLCCSPIMPEIH